MLLLPSLFLVAEAALLWLCQEGNRTRKIRVWGSTIIKLTDQNRLLVNNRKWQAVVFRHGWLMASSTEPLQADDVVYAMETNQTIPPMSLTDFEAKYRGKYYDVLPRGQKPNPLLPILYAWHHPRGQGLRLAQVLRLSSAQLLRECQEHGEDPVFHHLALLKLHQTPQLNNYDLAQCLISLPDPAKQLGSLLNDGLISALGLRFADKLSEAKWWAVRVPRPADLGPTTWRRWINDWLVEEGDFGRAWDLTPILAFLRGPNPLTLRQLLAMGPAAFRLHLFTQTSWKPNLEEFDQSQPKASTAHRLALLDYLRIRHNAEINLPLYVRVEDLLAKLPVDSKGSWKKLLSIPLKSEFLITQQIPLPPSLLAALIDTVDINQDWVETVPYDSFFENPKKHKEMRTIKHNDYQSAKRIMSSIAEALSTPYLKKLIRIGEEDLLWQLSAFSNDLRQKLKNYRWEDLQRRVTQLGCSEKSFRLIITYMQRYQLDDTILTSYIMQCGQINPVSFAGTSPLIFGVPWEKQANIIDPDDDVILTDSLLDLHIR